MHSFKQVILSTAASMLFCLPVHAEPPAGTAEQELLDRVTELLRRYQANDQPGVLEMMDSRFTILGSSFAVNVRTPDALKSLMTRDFAQWGSARFENLRNVDIRSSEQLATVFFEVTFTATNGGPVPLRLCTTWNKVGGKWLLTQSASAVPERS